MRVGLTVAAVLVLLAGTAFADPFTGRYNIESIATQGVSASGFIDFFEAPMGTASFKLGDSFVSGFSIVVSGPGISTLTYDSQAVALTRDDVLTFDAPLGDATLVVVRNQSDGEWAAIGDLDGEADTFDILQIGLLGGGSVRFWGSSEDLIPGPAAGSTDDANPAWRLVLASGPAPVPEPGTFVLSGLAVAGAFVWRRRKRKA